MLSWVTLATVPRALNRNKSNTEQDRAANFTLNSMLSYYILKRELIRRKWTKMRITAVYQVCSDSSLINWFGLVHSLELFAGDWIPRGRQPIKGARQTCGCWGKTLILHLSAQPRLTTFVAEV